MCRLGHKKSRKGCVSCKKRRVKCDEQAPCRNCVRRGEQCSLLAASPSSSSERNTALPNNSQEWLQDLGLMRHFVKDLTQAALGQDHIQHLWQEVVAEEALKYPFLMHGILALSALHIVHTRPADAEKYLRICDNHQAKALEMFRSILTSDLNEEMSSPMFALASTISISSMSRSCATAALMPGPKYVDVDSVAELFLLTKGVKDVVLVCEDWIIAGPLAPMLNRYGLPTSVNLTLPDEVTTRLDALHALSEDYCQENKHLAICKDAIEQLRAVHRNVLYFDPRDEVQTGHVWTWMTAVPMEFVMMIREANPVALIILGDFAAVSLSIETVWYTHNWGHYCLEGVGMSLDKSMHTWLEWPKAHAHNNMAILKQPKMKFSD